MKFITFVVTLYVMYELIPSPDEQDDNTQTQTHTCMHAPMHPQSPAISTRIRENDFTPTVNTVIHFAKK